MQGVNRTIFQNLACGPQGAIFHIDDAYMHIELVFHHRQLAQLRYRHESFSIEILMPKNAQTSPKQPSPCREVRMS
jgi:hypothetical protein